MSPLDTHDKALPLAPLPSGAVEHSLARSGFMVAPPTGPADFAQPSQAGGFTLASMVDALRRCWKSAVGVALLTGALAVGAVLLLVPAKYPATVRFLVVAKGDSRVFEGGTDELDPAALRAAQTAFFKSPLVIKNALSQKTSGGGSVRDLPMIRDQSDPVDWLESALKVDFTLGPELMRATLGGEGPEETAEVLNAVARGYVEENDNRDKAYRMQRTDQLNENQRQLEEELRAKRLALRAKLKALDLDDKDSRVASYQQAMTKVADAEKKYLDHRLSKNQAKQELATMEEQVKRLNELPIFQEKLDEMLRVDPRGLGLFANLEKVQKDILQTRAVAQPENVESLVRREEERKQELLKALEKLREDLRPELESILRGREANALQVRIYNAREKHRTLEAQDLFVLQEVERLREEARKSAPTPQSLPLDVLNLQEKVGNLEIALGKIAQTIVMLRAEPIKSRVTWLQPAVAATTKDISRQLKFAIAGGLAFFMLGLFGVTFTDLRRGRIGRPEEVVRGLNMAVVGTVPPPPSPGGPPAAPGAVGKDVYWQNQMMEAIDGIRTLLLHAARTENLRVVMITSAMGGEGKTSLACQLAASLARAWRKTLLIDGDLRNPTAHRHFNLPQEPGLCEVLRGEAQAGEAVQATELSRLWLAPAGHYDAHAGQALAQDNLRAYVEEMKQNYDFIIIDSCPVLPVADALQFGQAADGVLFSILRDVSRLPAVQAAQQRLNNLGIRTLGAVMLGAKNTLGPLGYQYATLGK